VLEPIRETREILSRTHEVLPYLQSNDKFHTLPSFRQQTLLEIFGSIRQEKGQRQAAAWLESALNPASRRGLPSPIWGQKPPSQPNNAPDKEPKDPYQDATRSQNSRQVAKTGARTHHKGILSLSERESVFEEAALLKAQLSPTGVAIHRLLLEAAFKVAEARGYAPGTSLVTFFCPLEVVAGAVGCHRTTLWRVLPKLKALKLLDASEWKTDLRGTTKNGGYLWQVKLDPTARFEPKLKHEEFKHHWRDLNADVSQGRTAHQQLQQSSLQESNDKGVNQLLDWALPPEAKQNSPLLLGSLTVADEKPSRVFALETILDLAGVSKKQRNEMVNLTANAICSSLGDLSPISKNFYRRVLWNLLRQFDQGNDWFKDFYDLASRTRTDYQERYAKKAGALFISRLKNWHLWQQLDFTPPHRVATGPLQTFVA
jgi:hypothetical protein